MCSRRLSDRSWCPKFIIDPYTGAEFAWAWNAPLMKIGGKNGLLITSGRATVVALLGFAIAVSESVTLPPARVCNSLCAWPCFMLQSCASLMLGTLLPACVCHALCTSLCFWYIRVLLYESGSCTSMWR